MWISLLELNDKFGCEVLGFDVSLDFVNKLPLVFIQDSILNIVGFWGFLADILFKLLVLVLVRVLSWLVMISQGIFFTSSKSKPFQALIHLINKLIFRNSRRLKSSKKSWKVEPTHCIILSDPCDDILNDFWIASNIGFWGSFWLSKRGCDGSSSCIFDRSLAHYLKVSISVLL